jgi:GABA permease
MNPFRSEASAYGFLFLTIGAVAAIAVAAQLGGPYAALGVLAAIVLAGLAWGARRHEPEAVHDIEVLRGVEGERRILVVANETVGGARLFEEIRTRSDGYLEQVLVLSPALNSALRYWVSDEDGARAQARARLDASLERLAAAGIDARGEIGDADPLQAIEDALRTFGADEIIISTHPPERSNWLERGVVDKARERFPVPVTHVVGEEQLEQMLNPRLMGDSG